MASSITDRANIAASIASLISIQESFANTDAALSGALSLFELHMSSDTAHPDIRADITVLSNDITSLSTEVIEIKLDLSELEARVTAIEPSWDAEGNYTGPISDGLIEDNNFGLILLDEDQMDDLLLSQLAPQ